MFKSIKTSVALFSALVLFATGCQTPSPDLSPNGTQPSVTQSHAAPGGFSLTDRSSLSSGDRSTFNDAVRAMQADDHAQAAELLSMLSETPDSPAAVQINLGIALRETDAFEEAESALRSAVEKNEKHPVARNELGITLRRMGRFDEAREQYEAALELHPDFHFARKNLAILCDLYLTDLVCALNHYRRYAAAVPSDEATQIWIADLENRLGQGKD